jgi:hypothetical protein
MEAHILLAGVPVALSRTGRPCRSCATFFRYQATQRIFPGSGCFAPNDSDLAYTKGFLARQNQLTSPAS